MVMYSVIKPLIILPRKSEILQRNVCLTITGASRGTSNKKIYQELGLESLQLRRCLIYKVFKNE